MNQTRWTQSAQPAPPYASRPTFKVARSEHGLSDCLTGFFPVVSTSSEALNGMPCRLKHLLPSLIHNVRLSIISIVKWPALLQLRASLQTREPSRCTRNTCSIQRAANARPNAPVAARLSPLTRLPLSLQPTPTGETEKGKAFPFLGFTHSIPSPCARRLVQAGSLSGCLDKVIGVWNTRPLCPSAVGYAVFPDEKARFAHV